MAMLRVSLGASLLLTLTVLVLGFPDENPSDERVLVIVEDLTYHSSHSIYFQTLSDRGYQLDFKLASDNSLTLQKFGEYLYDAAIIFAPKAEAFGELDLAAILDFVDSGHDLILVADKGASGLVRDIALECGVDIDETPDSVVVDHQKYAISDLDTVDSEHTVIVSRSLVNSTMLLGTEAYEDDIVYKGVALSLNPTSDLVVPVLSASPSAYSASPAAVLSSPPALQGASITLVAAVQARNNARVIISGSLSLFSNRLFNLKYEVPGEGDQTAEHYNPIYHSTANRQLAVELTKWAFHERGHLKAVELKHHRAGEEDEPPIYRIGDDIEFSVGIFEWRGKSWQPYVATDVQLQFYMMSPYVLTTLKHNGEGLFYSSFRVPDVYGVFQFKLEYSRLGYSTLSLSKQIPVRPFRHDEYERFIGSAYPYYASAFSMMAGFFVFGLFIIYHKPVSK